MLNKILVFLAVFVVQQYCNMPVSVEGMFFPDEDIRRPTDRSTPIKTPVVFDDPTPVKQSNEKFSFIFPSLPRQPSSVPSPTSHVNHIGKTNRRRLREHPGGNRQPLQDNIMIVFPSSSTSEDSPVASDSPPVNENSGSDDSGILFPNLNQDLRATQKEVLLDLINDNSTECNVDIGWIPVNGSCKRLLARSSCADGEWLVYTSGSFQCQERPCPWEQVLFNDKCVSVSDFDVCPRGHILYVDLSGQASCDCQFGYVYGPTSGQCYAQYTQGPCENGQYVVIDEELDAVKCISNPCNLDGWIRHERSNGCYLKLYDGFCDQKAMRIDEVNRTVSCEDILPFNIFNVPRLNKCPPGSLRDFTQKCRAYLPRIPVASTFPKAKYGACPPKYTRDPLGTCKKVFNLFAS